MQNRIRKVHACLAVCCHPHLLQTDRDLLRATAVKMGGGTDTEIRAQKADPGEENSPAGTRTCDLSITGPALQPLSYSRSHEYDCQFPECSKHPRESLSRGAHKGQSLSQHTQKRRRQRRRKKEKTHEPLVIALTVESQR